MPAATTPSPASPGSAPRSALEPAGRWTRDRWLRTADDLLRATEAHASPHRSLIRLPGPVSASGAWSDGLEGFARTFLLAAFRVRGEQGDDPHGTLERYAEGLRSGTDPDHPERWPRIDERRQAVVEAASVAVALAETRPWLWDRLDDTTRARTVDWLAGIVGTRGYTNNWLWFQNVVEAFLSTVGGPWDQADLDRNAETAESLYVGDGWYSDGRGRDGRRQSFDHYAGWAWHLYPLLQARMLGRPLETTHAERLHAYLDQAQHLVGSRGAPLLQGRSVTYRVAVLAPFWAGALADATPLTPGATRTLTGAVADHFWSAGAVDERGLLSIGWHRRFDRVRQLYTGGSSPYWASKGFLGLLLPADHAVWTAEPELPEAWRAPRVTTLGAPGWIVSSTPADGLVRVVNHGSDRAIEGRLAPRADDPFYRRQAYSNATSPQLSGRDVAAPTDSHTALLDARGLPSHRDVVDRVVVDRDDGDQAGPGSGAVAVSHSRVHWLDLPSDSPDGDATGWSALRHGPRLTTASVVHGPHEVRLAWWSPLPTLGAGPTSDPDRDAAWPDDPGPWRIHVGGWPLAADAEDDLRARRDDSAVQVVRTDGVTSLVRGLPVMGASAALDDAGTTTRQGADPFARCSTVPWLRTTTPVRAGEVVAALVVLSGEPSVDDDADVPTVRLRDGDPTVVEVAWPDRTVVTVPVDTAQVDA